MDASRRHLVQLLAGLGLTAGTLDLLDAQARIRVTADALKRAQALHDGTLSEDQLEIVRAALQQSLDEFAQIRALDLDDAIGLPVVFRPSRGR